MDYIINTVALQNFRTIIDTDEGDSVDVDELVSGINDYIIPNVLTPVIRIMPGADQNVDNRVTQRQIASYDVDRNGTFDELELTSTLITYFAHVSVGALNAGSGAAFQLFFNLIRSFNQEYNPTSVPAPAANVPPPPTPDYQECLICTELMDDNKEVIKCPHCVKWYHTICDPATGNYGAQTLCSSFNQDQRRCPNCRGIWLRNCQGMTKRPGPVIGNPPNGGKKKSRHYRRHKNKKQKTRRHKKYMGGNEKEFNWDHFN